MLLHQSLAVAGPGELLASFPLRLRNSGPKPSADYKYRATVCALSASPEEVPESGYEMSASLVFERGEESYSAFFQDPFKASATPVSLGERFDTYNAKAAASYPYLTRLPRVAYVQESMLFGRFAVTLTPFTMIYTAAAGFWEALGFEQGSYESFPGSSLKHAPGATAQAFGFSNREARTWTVYGRVLSSAVEPVGEIYAEMGGTSKQPHLEIRFLQNSLPLALAKRRPMTRTQVADGLATLVETGLHLLNLDRSAIAVESAGRYLSLKSKEYGEEAAASVVLAFSTELMDFLQLDSDVLHFPLSDSRHYELRPRQEEEFDPLAESYPVSLCLQQGEAKNFVQGRGFTSLLAVMRGKEDFVGDGAVFCGNCEQLTVRFLDKRLKPVTLRERSTTLTLTLELTPE